MPRIGSLALSSSAAPTDTPPPGSQVEAGGQILTTFLSSDALLWGCIALALIAMVSVSRVISRRREVRAESRKVRARSEAMHAFLDDVRGKQGAGAQALWSYDFGTRKQQNSDELKRLVVEGQDKLPSDAAFRTLLKDAGLDLAALAHEHRDETEPYTVQFGLRAGEGRLRQMVLQACNIRNTHDQVQRTLAVIRQVEDESGEGLKD